MQRILITGGAGFVGSNLALRIKKNHPDWQVATLDNLYRRGSELNLTRFRRHGIQFYHGDIRIVDDVFNAGPFDLLIECSAEPSVSAGYGGSPSYLTQTNLTGTLNCLDVCRAHGAAIVFLSTSRVYPMGPISNLGYEETDTRLVPSSDNDAPGVSTFGFSETFTLNGARSLYGATKLCSELMIQEYLDAFDMKGIINRCGVLTGPWQMGKVDQGFVVLWVSRHLWQGTLSYIGYGGAGKQLRDILHVDDLYRLVMLQVAAMDDLSGEVFNVGGGPDVTTSLLELTAICREVTGNRIPITAVPETRAADIPYYVSDIRKVYGQTDWKPRQNVRSIVTDIYEWLKANEQQLKPILMSE